MKTKETWSDPIVDEIHEIRKRLVREAGGTLDALVDKLMKSQERHGERLVSRQRPQDGAKAG
ncbi:MAG: hypothetical protein HUU46_22365 [Candidatus Hydrogenedentes bacterium]|nr:hypothetical protein [Candidatus Hydrogenedentota bacterium]